jgi:hypothetical protein
MMQPAAGPVHESGKINRSIVKRTERFEERLIEALQPPLDPAALFQSQRCQKRVHDTLVGAGLAHGTKTTSVLTIAPRSSKMETYQEFA